jgi:hypothetical protein
MVGQHVPSPCHRDENGQSRQHPLRNQTLLIVLYPAQDAVAQMYATRGAHFRLILGSASAHATGRIHTSHPASLQIPARVQPATIILCMLTDNSRS